LVSQDIFIHLYKDFDRPKIFVENPLQNQTNKVKQKKKKL